MRKLELWGGPECTVNRVGDTYRDQLRDSGHHDRIADLDLFGELGIQAIRYPVLWERVAPDAPNHFAWDWPDARLQRLRALGIRPILGLVHHGSGPRYTNLLAEDFASGLAAYARAVAQRYPWVEEWTPVNEPVTTARFSALYGLWYPHVRDERSFWLALINQIDGARRAMAEIRSIIPSAKLIQTDDLGRTYATAAVRDQAAFDNARRWMSWDLLCGRVTPDHCMWRRLCDFGFGDRLRMIADAPCPPDIIGVNHYLTSDRFLDHRVRRYPEHLRGGNGRQRFADTEAVRVLDPPPPGLRGVLREAWSRYRIPVAVTEVHNGCTREEQMRWIADAWAAATELRHEGVDVRAVTSWSLLGSCGWNTLLTSPGRYEPGVYDISSGTPHPTAMATLLRTLTQGGVAHPVSAGRGWWGRPIRLHHPVVPRPAPMRDRPAAPAAEDRPLAPLLIVGDEERIRPLTDRCLHRGIAFHCLSRASASKGDLPKLIGLLRPWAAIAPEAAEPHLLQILTEYEIPAVELGQSDDIEHLLDKLIDRASYQKDQLAA